MTSCNYPELDTLFNNSCKHLLQMPWVELYNTKNWDTLLPIPKYEYPKKYIMYVALGSKDGIEEIEAHKRDKAAYWAQKAKNWFEEYKFEIDMQIHSVKKLMQERVNILSKPYDPLLNIDEKIFKDWVSGISHLSLKEFIRLNISSDLINDYISPIILEHREKYKLEEYTKRPYKTFEELFFDPIDIELCLQVLRIYRPEKPLLGEGNNWQGNDKDKAVIIAWIERMENMKKPKIHKLNNRKQLVTLLNNYFSGLKMGEYARSFSNIVDPNLKEKMISLLPN